MPGYYRQYTTAKKKPAAGTPAPVKRIRTAPVQGDPDAIDWMACDCGYVRPTSNGKPVPKRLDQAYQWTENPGRGRKPALLTEVRQLALRVYGLGYFHSGISIFEDPGYPDIDLWGPAGPRRLVRELKAMNGTWQPGQKQHLLSLHESGFNVAVWKPCCLLSGLVDLEMADLAGVPPKGRGELRLRGRLGQAPTWQDVADGHIFAD